MRSNYFECCSRVNPSDSVPETLSNIIIYNKKQDDEIAKKANKDDLSEVAKSGRYYDLIDKPVALPNPKPITINGQRYDGSEAVTVTVSSGGGGGGTPVEIDDTLTQSGKAADAKATGDALNALNGANAAQNTEIAKKANDADLAKVAKSGSYNDLIDKPIALPNPKPITINGQRYDGSEAVTVIVSSEGGGTPVEIDDTLTQSGKAADAKVVGDKLSELNKAKANNADLASVAKSGSYNDLTNKPTIPTVPSALPNPNKLILSGAVTAEYDGSAEVNVEIPAGGSGSYTLPVASPTTLGGVMPVAKTGDMTQAVGVDEAGGLWTMAGGGGGESEFAGTETLLASGTIPSGTEAMYITDSGVTYDEFLKHRYVKVTFRSTENNYPEYSFKVNPSATWHLNGIGNNESSGHFSIFEPVGKLLRPAMTLSSVYSTLGSNGFIIGDYNIDPRSAFISYDQWHSYQGSNTMKFAFASKATTADWNWWIYALD